MVYIGDYGWFMLKSILIHLIFLYSIFDIYFTSPLLHGMETHKPKISKPPAKRLVLYLADGLRADACFEDTAMPYVRNKALTGGTWRVSHTRVPTESRPGHVAIIGGFYEDVSAVAKGWKENPVEFDSVFNQSYRTYAFASTDIINIFTKGNIKDNIEGYHYPVLSDFAAKDLTALDTWTFNRVEEFFKQSKDNAKLTSELHKDQLVFFVYLVGIDSNGHRFNPISKETRANIELVDAGVKRITELFESYYGDSSTAYILTSDHGMTEWGTHGSGLTAETLTPMVTWGAGVRGVPGSESQMSVDKAENIAQADIAPYMAALLGINFPVNSVGVLHTDLLTSSLQDKSELMMTNALQISEQFMVSLRNKQKKTFSLLFRPYSPLSGSEAQAKLRDIRLLIQSGRYEEAIAQCSDLIQRSMDGITYYHKYDRFFLGGCITLSFVGWMLYTLVFLLENYMYPPRDTRGDNSSSSRSAKIVWWTIRSVILISSYAQSLPWTHMLYAVTPTFPLEITIPKLYVLKRFCKEVVGGDNLKYNMSTGVILLVILEVVVHSFFHRELLSLAMIILALTDYKRYDWLATCLITMIFPLLPVVGRGANYFLVVSGGCIALTLLFTLKKNISKVTKFQGLLVIVANINVVYTSYSISNGDGLPLISQISSWSILVLTWLIPLLDVDNLSQRLITLNTGLFALYNLMSTSYEGWFLLALSLFLQCWIKKESKQDSLDSSSGNSILTQTYTNSAEGRVSLSDLRRSMIYLLMITVGFFGTGNIASLNSFEPASLFCFVTEFSPFSMGFILLLKVIIPFILIACAFHVIISQSSTKQDGVFLIILLMSDFMGIHFFMWVQDYGSWLDIGTSISHYVITLVTTLVLIILSKFSQFIMTFTLIPSNKTNKLS